LASGLDDPRPISVLWCRAMMRPLAFLCTVAVIAAAGASCSHKKHASASAGAATSGGAAVPGAGGLVIEEVKTGNGAPASTGKMVSVHYVGRLTDGTKFDSSYDRGQPIDFPLGAGVVIKGWDQGVAGMKVGGKRKLTIPPDLAYGARGTPGGPIPPNATLVFDVELMAVR
jgi:FKBP-type peptidyl-prolyl cis-trans isomerase FkpA